MSKPVQKARPAETRTVLSVFDTIQNFPCLNSTPKKAPRKARRVVNFCKKNRNFWGSGGSKLGLQASASPILDKRSGTIIVVTSTRSTSKIPAEISIESTAAISFGPSG